MNKYNIENGMKLILRDNNKVFYVIDGYVGKFKRDTDYGDIIVFHASLDFFLDFYEEDLTYKSDNENYDIMEIHDMKGKILWKAEDVDLRNVKLGDLVKVRDGDGEEWKIRKFVKRIPFEHSEDIYVTLDEHMENTLFWKQCRVYRK